MTPPKTTSRPTESLGRATDLQDAPRRVVVIGFGSPIRGDDAVGPLVADRLREMLESPAAEVVSRHILTAELAETIRDATLVIFLDASVDGKVGEIMQREVQPDTRDPGPLVHALDVGGLLGWTEALYGDAPPAVLVSTCGQTFDYANCQLSATVNAMLEPMAHRVCDLIHSHLGMPAHFEQGSTKSKTPPTS